MSVLDSLSSFGYSMLLQSRQNRKAICSREEVGCEDSEGEGEDIVDFVNR